MKHFLKKSGAGATLILALVVIGIFFGWIINISHRECRSNKDCGSEAYCGSDFSCHTYPTIQKTVVQYNFLIPSFIIGIAIIIAAIIFRGGRILHSKKSEEHEAEHKNNIHAAEEEAENPEGYYKSNGNIKTP